ncbi:hypothetical protein B0A75_04580 [Flavobacterium oncorhynchi]|uniref:Uncharacterized protein n=1 Tax=Flavobacterium oncorhynchi TaxID=728056 RepID=A0A226I753_9FLAO|nr:hypothetical protein [Flavobacterium oncorhynchi]OXB01721.1 hypothetical protein B0A75_04580 [Flavobacterium oncorhynchi]
METVQINKSAAVKAHDEATPKQKTMLENLFGKKVFVKNIRERIQTIQDVFELNDTTEADFYRKWNGFSDHEIGQALEVLIVAAYNEGKLPDWTNKGEYKYFAYFKMGSPSGVGFSSDHYVGWTSSSFVGSRLVFVGPDAKQNLLDAVKKFLPEYQKSRTT